MNESNYEQQLINQHLSRDLSDKYASLKTNLGEEIIYIDPQYYQDNLRDFNQRNPTYGVTVDFRFLKTIQQCDFLESSQLQFYINLFRKAYPDVKIATATCHFFADFIVSLQKPISFQQQNQTNSTGYQSQIFQQESQKEQSKDQSQYKLSEEFLESKVLNKNLIHTQQNTNISTQSNNSIINNTSNITHTSIITKNPNDSIISIQQQAVSTAKPKPEHQYAQSQIITKNPKEIDDKMDKYPQSIISTNKNANNQTPSQLIQEEVQISKTVQVNQSQNQQSQIKMDNQKNQQSSKISDSQSNPVQTPLNTQSNLNNENDQIKSTQKNESNILSHQFINSNCNQFNEKKNENQSIWKDNSEIKQDKQQINQVQTNPNQDQFTKAQSIIQTPVQQNNQQLPFVQPQVEQQSAQPPPEKKFFFQITNMTIQKPPQSENINKSYLPSLIKQLAEINNLTEEQLKDQDYWYFPINQLQSHWISVVINFKKKEIFYFDSYYKKKEPVIIQGINSILEHFNINPKNFQITPIYLQQINGYDCGVFILLSLLYTLQQKSYNYNQSIATKFRKGILYNLAVIGAQQNIDQVYLEFIVDQG